MQALYPKICNDSIVPTWQKSDMAVDLDPFDRDRVREEMKKVGLKQGDLAKEMGLNQSAISNILNGTRQVKAHEATFIYRRLNLAASPTIVSVPIIGISNAGAWREAIELRGARLPIPAGMAGQNGFAIQCEGDSLDELLLPNAYLVIDPDQRELYSGRVYLIENSEHETTVKVYQGNPARFEPRSSNEEHKVIFMGDEPIRVIGRVVWQSAAL